MITYHPIGIVKNSIVEPLRPEMVRAIESRLVLESHFAPSVPALEAEQYPWVIYHLHHVEGWDNRLIPELFTRRIACRPNPIGVTLTQVVSLSGSTIIVVGLDAINGSPILDIKPYKPIFDNPPVHLAE